MAEQVRGQKRDIPRSQKNARKGTPTKYAMSLSPVAIGRVAIGVTFDVLLVNKALNTLLYFPRLRLKANAELLHDLRHQRRVLHRFANLHYADEGRVGEMLPLQLHEAVH